MPRTSATDAGVGWFHRTRASAPPAMTTPVVQPRCASSQRPVPPVRSPQRARDRPVAPVARAAPERTARAPRPGPYR